MSDKNDLLIELGTEELPPRALKKLSDAFAQGIVDGLRKAGFEPGESRRFATPRRLAVLIPGVASRQPDRRVEKKGPALKAAFDEAGEPSRALQGFARSCGVAVDELEQRQTEKGVWLYYCATQTGETLAALLGGIVEQSLAGLPIPKRMRWGDRDAEFVRPVHWLVMLHGSEVIDAGLLATRSGNQTYGHRFHCDRPLTLAQAADYEATLRQQGYVIADFESRRQSIRQQVESLAETLGGEAVIDDDLLDEVTALNEWPVAIGGEFESRFLSVPSEALIKTMQDNQKYFPVVDARGALKNHFVTISNIDSRAPEKVRQGNERVIRPRLADAMFFWEQDQKQPLEAFGAALENVVFQEKLGSIADKVRRVTSLATDIAGRLGVDVAQVRRAAQLSKCDLMTDMVGEFAALQGVMGRRYAEVAGEAPEVALALDEQYMPRGASDDTASQRIGQILSISDRIDSLVGIFAIGQKPTGVKDPYALRRAALGVLRTLIERGLALDLRELIAAAAKQLADRVDAAAVEAAVFDYIVERLRAYYLDQQVPVDVFDAVAALKPSAPLDFDRRVAAVTAFRAMPEAASLAAANKRVGNILKKADTGLPRQVDPALMREAAEQSLYAQLQTLSEAVLPLFEAGEYESALKRLSVLRQPVDDFFDNVMVMVDDEAVKHNRMALLGQMQDLFLRVADLSRLHAA